VILSLCLYAAADYDSTSHPQGSGWDMGIYKRRAVDYKSVEKVGDHYFGSTNCKDYPPQKMKEYEYLLTVCDWVRLTPVEVRTYKKMKEVR